MPANIPSAVYPFSTQDGKAIPLDILKPAKLLIAGFTNASSTPYTLAATDEVLLITSSENAVLVFDVAVGAITSGASFSKGLYLPKGVTVSTVALSTALNIRGVTTAGTAYIQVIERWAGLALDKQFVRK